MKQELNRWWLRTLQSYRARWLQSQLPMPPSARLLPAPHTLTVAELGASALHCDVILGNCGHDDGSECSAGTEGPKSCGSELGRCQCSLHTAPHSSKAGKGVAAVRIGDQ
jgi:hypothetical protein